jgi:hypothetical protein
VRTPGRNLFGAAVFASGIIMLVWHDYHDYDQLRSVLNAADGPVFVYIAAIAQIVGGLAMQLRQTAKAGAAIVAVTYLAFALMCVPRILATPRVYDSWGNFFEPFSLATGAAIVYAPKTLKRIGRILFGLCVASFALEQAFYLDNTAVLVPKWIPPNQHFWAIATTVAFALAAVALLTNRAALLAGRLLTIMIASFGIIVWLPILISNPHSLTNWSETAETFAIAGASWILTNLLT